MRRVMFTVAVTVLMAGAVPASALAHHHHSTHHSRTHHTKLRHFGHQTTAPTSTNAADNAGTVQSFTGGVLTLALNDGSTVKGMVTNDTELECTAPETSSTIHQDGDRGGPNDQGNSSGAQNDQGDDNGAQGDDNGPGDDDQGEDQNENNMCTTANLVPGAVVHEAVLRIGSSGAMWEKLELVS